jgi:hypothetical protein
LCKGIKPFGYRMSRTDSSKGRSAARCFSIKLREVDREDDYEESDFRNWRR